MERNIPSLYTALDTLLVTEQFETAFHLARSLYPYWETYENLSDGVEWLLRLAGPDAEGRLSGASLSSLYAMLGNLFRHQSEYPRAANHYELGLAALKDQPDYRVHAFILGGLGEIAFRQGRYEDATRFYRSYLQIGRQADDARYIADAHNALGRLATIKGDWSEALEYHAVGRHLCEESGYQTGLAWMFNALGELERARGKHAEATGHFQESVAIFARLGNRGAQMLALQNLAFALLPVHPAGAETLFNKTLSFWERGPARHGLSLSLVGLSRVDLARDDIKMAQRQFSAASRVLDRIGVELELGDRLDYEIARERLQKATGQDPASVRPIKTSLDRPVSTRTPAVLTRQERTVIQLAAQGLTDKQIAARLVISSHTVNAHLKSIYRKLLVNNRTSAVAAARSRRLL